jgi:hypothetical protein
MARAVKLGARERGKRRAIFNIKRRLPRCSPKIMHSQTFQINSDSSVFEYLPANFINTSKKLLVEN